MASKLTSNSAPADPINGTQEKTAVHNSTLLPTLVSFPQALTLFKERVEGLGFEIALVGGGAAQEIKSDSGLVLVPITSEDELSNVTIGIERYRARFPETVFIGIYAGRLRFKMNEAYRTGLSCIFSVPIQEDLLINKIFEIAPCGEEIRDMTFDQLMRVNVIELESAKSLDFNLYLFLPMNKKIIRYVEKDHPIDEKMIQKFKANPHYNLYICRSQLKKYLGYCQALIISGNEKMVGIDGGRKVAFMLSGLMGGFFNDESLSEDESTSMLENLKSLVEQLEDQSGGKKDLVKSVTRFASQQMTHYTHAQNVAAYCCLFGMAAGINEPETLRMGGLLHDLGLSDLPNELLGRELSEMSADQAAKYKLHPGGGKYSIEERKLKVPQGVLDMILFHHERPDGSGYPYGKLSAEIPLIAKICAFADEFDKLTSVRIGKRQLSPLAAMQRLAGMDGKPPSAIYEESIHQPIVKMFLKTAAGVGNHAQAKSASVSSQSATKSKPGKTGSRTSVEALLKMPRFAGMKTGKIDDSPEALQAALKDLKEQLKEHWTRKNV